MDVTYFIKVSTNSKSLSLLMENQVEQYSDFLGVIFSYPFLFKKYTCSIIGKIK